jgi:hypothetical protein
MKFIKILPIRSAWLGLFFANLLTNLSSAHELSNYQNISAQIAYPGLDIAQQKLILKYLESSTPMGKHLHSYWIPKESEDLKILAPNMVTKLYQWSRPESLANCYFTSISAHSEAFLNERFMGLNEYLCHIAKSFRSLKGDETLQPGDVIRLQRARGKMDTHSVVYIGHPKDSPTFSLVLSKNGPIAGPYLVMNLWDLQNRVYPSSAVVGIYRRNIDAPAPTDQSLDHHHTCRQAMDDDR